LVHLRQPRGHTADLTSLDIVVLLRIRREIMESG
jgi:hypothetical protein